MSVCMIEEAQETTVVVENNAVPSAKRAFAGWQARRLSAIEIAEGALLADIGVVFHLLIRYLPVGGQLLALLVPVIFALLVLRRGLYVGCMSLCVALFIVSIVVGPGGTPLMILEAGSGLFLGLSMRHRLHHFATIFLGVICGALALWAVILFFSLLSGGSGSLVHGLRQAYHSFVPLVALFFHVIGSGGFWQHRLFPPVDHFMQWGFQNWPILLYLFACIACTPLVIAVYWITNFFLRLLGYQVHPFPGYRLEGMLYWLVGRLLKLVPRKVLARMPLLYHLKCEMRRLNRARLRQRRLAREA
ncbi:MAG: DUF2232 domain-containing protein, partial [Ktedonobacteraceae bacterium]